MPPTAEGMAIKRTKAAARMAGAKGCVFVCFLIDFLENTEKRDISNSQTHNPAVLFRSFLSRLATLTCKLPSHKSVYGHRWCCSCIRRQIGYYLD